MRTLLSLASLCASLAACGAAHGQPSTAPVSEAPPSTPSAQGSPPAPAPQSLDEALTAQGLSRLEPAVVSRDMGHFGTVGPAAEGRRITMHVSAGWSASPPLFARRDDGTVFLIEPRPTTIVDRHVAGGCRHFFGGRMWLETIVYELPEGTSYGGTLAIGWEQHTEVVDYTPAQADGSACPPPAID